jgi:hypothetical protein
MLNVHASPDQTKKQKSKVTEILTVHAKFTSNLPQAHSAGDNVYTTLPQAHNS